MALIDHIHRCNRWDSAGVRALLIGGRPLGRLRPEMAKWLLDRPALFERSGDGVALTDRLDHPAARSDALRPVGAALAEQGMIGPLRGEDYRVVGQWGETPALVMDRAMVAAFGVRAFGLHVNGFVDGPDGPRLWIGTRAADRPVEPGKLDNMVAGGQPAGLSLRENLVKEAAEEAGLDQATALRARPVGAITYCMEEGFGLKRDTLFLYDLALAAGVTPQPLDGEMERFDLMAPAALLALLRGSFAFKFNVALVLIDFMIRHGLIGPDNEPDYLALVTGLHQGQE